MTGRIIAVNNCKGGVGKTACSAYLSLASSFANKKTLAIDLDPSSSLTLRSLGEASATESSRDSIISGSIPHPVAFSDTLFIAPENIISGSKAEFRYSSFDSRTERTYYENISKSLDSMRTEYETIVIDCSPRPLHVELLIMACADSIVCPVSFDSSAIHGMVALLALVARIGRRFKDFAPGIYVWPWGVHRTSSSAAKQIEIIKTIAEKYGMAILPPFPQINDFSDLLFSSPFETLHEEMSATSAKALLEAHKIAYFVLEQNVPENLPEYKEPPVLEKKTTKKSPKKLENASKVKDEKNGENDSNEISSVEKKLLQTEDRKKKETRKKKEGGTKRTYHKKKEETEADPLSENDQ